MTLTEDLSKLKLTNLKGYELNVIEKGILFVNKCVFMSELYFNYFQEHFNLLLIRIKVISVKLDSQTDLLGVL